MKEDNDDADAETEEESQAVPTAMETESDPKFPVSDPTTTHHHLPTPLPSNTPPLLPPPPLTVARGSQRQVWRCLLRSPCVQPQYHFVWEIHI